MKLKRAFENLTVAIGGSCCAEIPCAMNQATSSNSTARILDIEDRKRSEEALRESEERFRLIVDGIAGLVAIMSPTGELEVVNRQVLTLFRKNRRRTEGVVNKQ